MTDIYRIFYRLFTFCLLPDRPLFNDYFLSTTQVYRSCRRKSRSIIFQLNHFFKLTVYVFPEVEVDTFAFVGQEELLPAGLINKFLYGS